LRRIEQAVSLPGGEKNGIWARFLGVEAGIENKGLDSDSQASAEKRARGLEFEGLAEGFEFGVAAVVAGLGDR
jgi:hypothetical protein